jgi:hypothetical protein
VARLVQPTPAAEWMTSERGQESFALIGRHGGEASFELSDGLLTSTMLVDNEGVAVFPRTSHGDTAQWFSPAAFTRELEAKRLLAPPGRCLLVHGALPGI